MFNDFTEETRQIEDERLDFNETRPVLVKQQLYVFKRGCPVSAYKYVNLYETDQLIKTTLASLPHKDLLQYFSVTKIADKSILLTGGANDNNVLSSKTFLMDVQTEIWLEQSQTNLNIARFCHASTSVDE